MFKILLTLLLIASFIKNTNLLFNKILDNKNKISLKEVVSDFVGSLYYIKNIVIVVNVNEYGKPNPLTRCIIPKNIIGLHINNSNDYEDVEFIFTDKTNIKYLKLTYFYTKIYLPIDRLLKHYQQLENLEFYNTDFCNINITSLSSLKVLKGQNWCITSFPKNFSDLKIRDLFLKGCLFRYMALVEYFSGKTNNVTNVKSLFKEIFNNKYLNNIDLTNNNIGSYDIDFSGFSGTILNLSRNRIKSLNISICSLRNLEVLNLSANFISQVPASICNLVNLKELNLSYNDSNNCTIILPLKSLKLLNISFTKTNLTLDFKYHIENFTLINRNNHHLEIKSLKSDKAVISLFVNDFLSDIDESAHNRYSITLTSQLFNLFNVQKLTVNITSFRFFKTRFYNLATLQLLCIIFDNSRYNECEEKKYLRDFTAKTNNLLNITTLKYLQKTKRELGIGLLEIITVKYFYIYNCIINSNLQNISYMIRLEELHFVSCMFITNIENIILNHETLKNIQFRNNTIPYDMDQKRIRINLLKKNLHMPILNS
ncbi:Leucine rich repeat protein [Spraguea lophii 42_110]|uniref:Leucine rich repeat protein n=1 Tax=Spraguea lophii (strain 42_110) TaxID=1358809 RepID=S7W6L2_SPRLO|nr:Leucine rich repeat protein [Spraguea lophii 42_110]